MTYFTRMMFSAAASAALCLTLSSCASAQETQPGPIETEQGNDSASAKRPLVWAEYINAPDLQEMNSLAIGFPILQENTEITVITPPEGFDSAAFVIASGVRGIYLIKNEMKKDIALESAAAIEGQVRGKLSLESQPAEASDAIYASTFISKERGDLKLVNVIVSEDGMAGHTITIAFTY